jgi:tRNA dimethylallyltransferase
MELEKLVEIVTQEPPAKRRALPRVVFVVGPTSSGKTELGLRLAKEFSGEVINADARQIYRVMDIGTGKPEGKRGIWKGHTAYIVRKIPHYIMDFLPPEETYTAAQWREAALRAIKGIVQRGNLPIVVGGTGLYISSLIDNYVFPGVPAHPKLREAYEAKSVDDLVHMLLALDPEAVNVVDLQNKRRVIRALEVATFTGKKFTDLRKQGDPLVDAFQVGIYWPQQELYKRVDEAVDRMVDEGLIDEVRTLRKRGLAWDSPAMSAIGYQDLGPYLKGDVPLEDAIQHIKTRTRHYTKRQWAWFKRDPRIRWNRNKDEAEEWVREWLRE